jgi:hypothetical protein
MSTNFNDDDIDESFIETKPQQTQELTPDSPPLPLLPEEIQQVQSILSSKSVKEHLDYLSKVMVAHDPKLNEYQQVQVETNVKKNFGDKSKRELNKAIFSFLNQNNKHVFLQKKVEVQKEEEVKLSREELKNKLHNKMKMNNKNNLKEMYEKLQEEMEKNNINLDGTQDAPENNGEEGEAVASEANKKKKKKKKLNLAKLDPKQLQNQLINQMSSYMKNTPFGGSV